MQGREQLLDEYKGLLSNLEEALELKRANQTDEEVDELIEETKAELRTVVASLNKSEDIEVTPELVKTVLQDSSVVIHYPSAAPYEIYYDNSIWYSCVITEMVPPESPLERIRFKAWILGYNIEEEVYSEQLRVWQPQPAEGVAALRSGVACHAINPHTGRYQAAKVERLTLNNTVMVAFEEVTDKDGVTTGDGTAPPTTVEEVPLSHVRVGRFYQQLRKKTVLTPEARAERRAENIERKRMRQELKRKQEAILASQNANDWQRLVNDMGFGGAQTKRKR
ncbi:hypothetical protein TRVL_01788 [Trypanosoma vivax]|nr:hypothetical protein TRVL_01788 [Trypanosoma vivax]